MFIFEKTKDGLFFLGILVSCIIFSNPLFAQNLTIYTEEVAPYNFTEGNKIVGVSTEVVETGEFVAVETLLALAGDPGGNTASAVAR